MRCPNCSYELYNGEQRCSMCGCELNSVVPASFAPTSGAPTSAFLAAPIQTATAQEIPGAPTSAFQAPPTSAPQTGFAPDAFAYKANENGKPTVAAQPPHEKIVKTRPQGRGVLIAGGITLIFAVTYIAILLVGFVLFIEGYRGYDLSLAPVIIIGIAITILAVLTLVFCNNRKLWIVELLIGILTLVCGFGLSHFFNLMFVELIDPEDIYAVATELLFINGIDHLLITHIYASGIMIVCGAILNAMKLKEVVAQADAEGMIQNRRPKGKVLLIIGGIFLILLILTEAFSAIFYSSMAQQIFSLMITSDPYHYPGILDLVLQSLARYLVFFFLLVAVLSIARSSSPASGVLLIILGVLTLLISVGEMIELIALFASVHENLLIHHQPLYILVIYAFIAFSSIFVIVGGILNARSPKRIPAFMPQMQLVTITAPVNTGYPPHWTPGAGYPPPTPQAIYPPPVDAGASHQPPTAYTGYPPSAPYANYPPPTPYATYPPPAVNATYPPPAQTP